MTSYEEILRKEQKDLFDSSFYHFTKYCLGYKDVHQVTHAKIFAALQSEKLRKLICVPRGTFKSSIASVSYPMWKLTKKPNLRILIDSEIYTNSKNFLREIKAQFESNECFRRLYGEYKGPLWNEGEIIISTRTKPLKEPSIVCSGIGAGKTSQHYDLIIADDLSSYTNIRSKDLADKTIDHYRLYTSLLEPDGEIVIIGTRYSEMDIIGFIIENELMIEHGDVKKLKELYCGNR